MKKIKAFSLALTMFICFLTFGQDKKVTGLVSDNHGPLAGANVVIKGTTLGVQTDIDGNYTIKVKQGETLVFSFIGMQEQSHFVGSSNVMNIRMQESKVMLEESYGYTPDLRRKKPSNTETIEVKSIEKNTTESSKEDIKEMYKNDTLIVIDGVPTNYEGFSKLDPNSIESITVLKDVSIGIITCSRRGYVIVVKTKQQYLTYEEIVKLNSSKPKAKLKDSAFVRFRSLNKKQSQ